MTRTVVGAPEPPDEPADRLRDPHAERAVLAAVVSGGPLALHLVSVLQEEDFTDAGHREVFAATATLAARARSVGPAAVATEVERRGHGAPPEMVHRLMTAVPPGTTAVHYAAIIRDLTALRRKGTGASTADLPDFPMRGFLTDD